MDEMANRIWNNIVESVDTYVAVAREYASMIGVVAALFIFAYLAALTIAKILQKLLKYEKLEDFIIKNGIMRTKTWGDTKQFMTSYVIWYVIIAVMTLTGIPFITDTLYSFANKLTGFILLLTIGLFIGSIIAKFVRDVSMDFGWEDKLVRYGLADALGDISITGLLTGFVKWYITLLFIGQGLEYFWNMTVLSKFVSDVIAYAPKAVLGTTLLVVALMIADYVGDRIKTRKISFAETLAFCIESVIVFFGIVMALPHFGVTNVSLLEDSFKILMVGVALAFAIAAGFGMKDTFTKAKSYEDKK